MRLRLERAGRGADFLVAVPDGSTPLAAVLRAAGIDPVPGQVTIDGRVAGTAEPVAALPIHDGSTVRMDASAVPPPTGRVQLVRVAGGVSGGSVELPAGRHDVGPARRAGRVEAPVVRIEVEAGGTVTLATVGTGAIRLDGRNPAGPVLEPVRPGMHIGTSEALFRIGPVRGGSGPPGHTGPSGRGRYQRTPRSSPPRTPPPPTPPKHPAAASPAPHLSWSMVLVPIPIAVALAILLSPHFLVFAAFTPLLAIGRWAEGRWRERRSERAAAAEWAVLIGDYETTLDHYAAQQAVRLRAASPDFAALLEVACSGGPGLWGVRPATRGYLQVPIGYGDLPGSWDLPPAAEPDVHELAARYRRLPDVPITLDLGRHLGAGLVGSEAADLAATAVAHLAATHGPADVRVALICDDDRLGRWDWLKWLPHLPASGRRAVATTTAEVAELFDPRGIGGEVTPPMRIVLVQSEFLLDTALAQLAAAPDRAQTRLVVVASAPERLPSMCTQVAVLEGGRLAVADLLDGQTVRGVLPTCADQPTVSALARALSRYLDPEAEAGGAALPPAIDLGQVLGGGFEMDEMRARWNHSGRALWATLGATEDGPLVVDLVGDGPHVLIAGTTGSGKSELLRTLIASLACRYSPERLNFVLVDFKGGGAFDACADLPHTVGVVTDLDEQLAARALRCLRAEIRHRERVLRAAGVSDLADLGAAPPLACLVLVIDEFATLAAELPEFVGSLVDVAQRGRSLGLHLVLATQRPSGVVNGLIRANTNLRVALRVQSDADSHDVLGATVAARIDRRTPGRGFALLGAGDLRAFQTALVSTQTPASGPRAMRVEPFRLRESTPVGASGGATARAGALTDLQRIVESSRAAATGQPPARVPWPAPLPDTIEAEVVWTAAGSVPGAVPLGLADRPDEQRVAAFRWEPRRGPLLAYGSQPSATTGVIVTAAAELARRLAADALHLYLFDLVPGSGLQRVARLPHVAVRVGPGDHELLLRAVDALERELDRRREAVRAGRGFEDSGPLIMIGLAGYHVALATAEELGRLDVPGRLERLIVEGPPLGIVTVLTTHHERGIPGRLASQISARLAFRLADPTAYTGFGLRPRSVPDLSGHRAVDLATGEEVVIATPSAITSAGAGRGGPVLVETLAERIPSEATSGHSRREGPVWRLCLGLRHSDLAPAVATLHPGSHLVITGGPASGRTTALRTVAGALRASGPCEVRVLTTRPEEWSGVNEALGAEALAAPVRQPTLVVVDGLDAASVGDAQLTALADDPLVRIVVADRVDAFRMPAAWLRRVLASRAGLLLQPQPDHGDVVRARLPMRSPVAHPPGRGYLVENGFAELVQVALPTTASTTTSVTACTSTVATTQTAMNP